MSRELVAQSRANAYAPGPARVRIKETPPRTHDNVAAAHDTGPREPLRAAPTPAPTTKVIPTTAARSGC